MQFKSNYIILPIYLNYIIHKEHKGSTYSTYRQVVSSRQNLIRADRSCVEGIDLISTLCTQNMIRWIRAMSLSANVRELWEHVNSEIIIYFCFPRLLGSQL